MQRILIGLVAVVGMVGLAQAGEIGFAEEFALAKDRAAVLKQLIPGTEDYYYYHALHYLNTEEFDKIDGLTKPWQERFGQTDRLTEIQHRYALSIYPRDPQRSLNYLRDKLGLQFNHQKPDLGTAPNLPIALDPKLIARATLRSQWINNNNGLTDFEDSAFDWLAAEDMDWQRRRSMLQRIQRPDLPNLVKLVADDLAAPRPVEFGSLAIHKQMTPAQLEQLLAMRPALLNQSAFVQVWLIKLQPGADEDWRHDTTRARAYFDRLLSFVRRLTSVHNALKAHVIYHRLVLDRSQGMYDKSLFIEYLKLPRRQHYMPKVMLDGDESLRHPANLAADYSGGTMLKAVQSDEPLVRDYLQHFLANADSPRDFASYIDDVYLRQLFAQTKIELGQGDPETWANQLPPEMFRQLKERVDIDFAPANKTDFATDEPVHLDLFVKNAPTLIVKVFEINTPNFYRSQLKEVDTDINLDGLVANAEATYNYTETPFRRVARRYEFAQLNKAGVYVIDFIGAGKSSRALVRKGRLMPLVTSGPSGVNVTIVDEKNQQVNDAAVWLGDREYTATDGVVLLPFSTTPGRRPIVIRRGDFACLDHIMHWGETYQLTAGIHVDREALLSQRMASVLVRPSLKLNDQPVSLKMLEDVKLRITAVDHDGIPTMTEVPGFKVFEDRESVHEFRVPPRVAAIKIELHCKVKSLTRNEPQDLTASEQFQFNNIDHTDRIECLHFAKAGSDYRVELLGKTGEARPDRPVYFSLKHRDFKQPVNVTLKTDSKGRVQLGALTDIESITANGPDGQKLSWRPSTDQHSYRRTVHARAGETVSLPYMGTSATPSREELALYEMVGGTVRQERFDALAIANGMLELRGLPAGNFELRLKRGGEKIDIRIVDGPVVAGYVLGKLRNVELPRLKPVQIADIAADGDNVIVRLRDASPFTRVHVFATRYQPAFSAYADLGKVRAAELSGTYPVRADSMYLAGRNIGDEYRYVLNRRYQKKYAGNMLDRPALLLNPWALRSTDTSEQKPEGGEEYRKGGQPKPSEAMPTPATARPEPVAEAGEYADLDFLANTSAVQLNLVPDKDGVIKLPKALVGPHSMIHVVAIDPLNTTVRTGSLPEMAANFLDLRLIKGLDPKAHFLRRREISVLPPSKPFVVADAANSRFEMYDSIEKVFGLYATLSKDPKLAEFAFITNWPNLKPEEKRAQYSKYACHELSFFLAKKDPEFFKAVIKPYLANKKDKTFLDRWLLGEDLREFLEPWRYDRLNVAERVLLGQRVPGESPKTARRLDELLRLRGPISEREQVLFDTAILGGALSEQNSLGRLITGRGFVDIDGAVTSDLSGQGLFDYKDNAPKAPPAPSGGSGGGGGRAPNIMGAIPNREGRTKMKDAEKERSSMAGLPADAEHFKSDLDLDDKSAGKKLFAGRLEKSVARLYRRIEATKEWAENNYYHLPIREQIADLVPPGAFWLDYAKHGEGAFLSKHVADASHTFSEMMLALAVLDLPFASAKHDVKFENNVMTLTPANGVIAFYEEVRPAGAPTNQVLVNQNFYRMGDRYREEAGERLDKFVTGEFVMQTVYGSQIVVTNPTPSKQRLSVLIQIPTGALPVSNGRQTRSVPVELEPYRTQTIDFAFYFPLPGKFAAYPVHVSKGDVLVAAATPATFDVVEKPSKQDTDSWEYVSINGTPDQVLALMQRENVAGLDLEKIAFRLHDKQFFTLVVQLLQDRHTYQPTVWSYGILHNAPATAREYLKHIDNFVAACGGPIDSPLLAIDPVERHDYEHLEYKPLVNARAHALGNRRQIVNPRIHEQYHRFLHLVAHHKQMNDDDRLATVYYLLLQDRFEEAGQFFAQVGRDRVASKLQYDYCAAYMEMLGDTPQKARAIAAQYANHPVDRWRETFAAMVHQLDEIEGKGTDVASADDRTQRQTQLASKTPSFDFTLEGKTMNLTWQNLPSVRVNYYLMDVELLFSRNPFVQGSSNQFASIRPNVTKEITLAAGQDKLAIPLPDELARRNVLVEVTAAGKTRSLPYSANAMNVQMIENYGQLKVTDAASGKPLAKVYVKTYVRLADGQVKFHKDGYTDQRGRFDYATVSTPDSSAPARFAILVLSDEQGAVIKEAGVPQQ